MNLTRRLADLAVGFLVLILLASGALAATGLKTVSPDQQELILLNWSDYMDPGLVAEFEARHGVRVRQLYFGNDEERDRLVLQTDGRGYDLAIVDGTTLGSYVKRGWVAPLETDRIPNLRHIDPRWRSAHRSAEDHAVPYFWGTLGIAYRSDLVEKELSSWRQLFEPVESLRGKIIVLDDTRDLIGMALTTLGHSPNAEDPRELAESEALLMQQKQYVQAYSYVTLDESSALVTGDVHAVMMYNGDAMAVQGHHENITYVVPEEGTILWVDYLAVMQSSPKKELAWKFINFLNEPENAARLAEYLYYPTPNRSAEQHLSPEFLEDELIFPSSELVERSTTYRTLSAQAMRRYATIWAHVTD